MKKKKKPADNKLKTEIAAELGLLEKVKEAGWDALTARETGKIGGIMRSRKKRMQKGM